MIILVPLFFIAINEQYFTEDHVIEEIPKMIVRPDEGFSEPVVEDTRGIFTIAEGILVEWNVNIWSDLQKLFN